MDVAGAAVAPGTVGEVVICGPNVTAGYEANPEANEEGFRDGWFRTGDQGVLDDEGYLTIAGRLKEIINRGGEKVSPREVDEVLLDHPAVARAVTFAIPHPKLGEEVGAAIVLESGAEASEGEVRDFVGHAWPGSRCRARWYSWPRSPRARRASCSASAWRKSSASGHEARVVKVCIYGAGAIGGYLAVELALAGIDVSCIAGGPHLKAMRENGLKLLIGGEERVTRIACAEEPGEFGPQDFVVMALKAPGAVAVADRLGPLIGPKTAVQEMGRLAGVAMPTIDMVLGLVKLRAREAGCYDG